MCYLVTMTHAPRLITIAILTLLSACAPEPPASDDGSSSESGEATETGAEDDGGHDGDACELPDMAPEPHWCCTCGGDPRPCTWTAVECEAIGVGFGEWFACGEDPTLQPQQCADEYCISLGL